MPRSTPSRADQELADHAGVSPRQVERWRQQGLIPPHDRQALGRGRGSTSRSAPGAQDLVRWLAQHERPGRRPGDLALLAFGAGLPVSEATVRAAFADAVTQATRIVDRLAPSTTEGSDAGAQSPVAAPRGTLVPARIRRIDAALAKLGVNWAAPQLVALDRGPDSPPANAGDWIAAAVSLFTDGPREVNIGYAGTLVRALVPAGAAAPVAGRMEIRSPEEAADDDGLIDEAGRMMFLPHMDMRVVLTTLTADATVEDLRAGWQMVVRADAWATGLCEAVEREIAAGTVTGPAVAEWGQTMFGLLPRVLLIQALRDPTPGPSSIATRALVLLFERNLIRLLRQKLPAGNFEILTNSLVTPPFLVPFWEDGAVDSSA